MNYSVVKENLENLGSFLDDTAQKLQWSSVFTLPSWLQTWWYIFGVESEMFLRTVSRNGDTIGIAPLMKKENTAFFLGSTDVCDYMDFVVVPGMETDFFHKLMDELKKDGIVRLDLAHVRPDSTVVKHLQPLAESNGYQVKLTYEETSLETELPREWDEYLASLSGKQRHEVRRKLRRLNEAGLVEYQFNGDIKSVSRTMDIFLEMFKNCREDKAEFLTERMEAFFRLLADNLFEIGLLRFGILKLDSKMIATIMCFDYHNCIYLYNSAYNPGYNHLSAGLLSKVLAIQESIHQGKKCFDFLKGSEPYKYHLGGREVALYRCLIDLK
jgi:CelD/BcsL family acetyltransferase involved in cellulose biosynthesis